MYVKAGKKMERDLDKKYYLNREKQVFIQLKETIH